MPHLKSAFKNLRKSRKRAAQNREIKDNLKLLLKGPVTKKTLPVLYKQIDKSVKKKILSPNKAGRVKSSLAKRVKG